MSTPSRSSLYWVAAALLCIGAVSDTAAAEAQVYTSKSRFRIPFRSDPAEMQRIGAREIRLYQSTDRGRSWQLAKTVAPASARFDFQAPGDGEYWFAVRTLDGRNQLYPSSDISEPGLKVVVDGTAPTLDIELRQLQPGRVQLLWQADDAYLDTSTLKLEFMQTGSVGWEQVSVVPQAKGQTSWSVPQNGSVAVRGTVSDRAGNVQQTHEQIRLEAAGQPVSRPRLDGPIAMDDSPIPSFPAAPVEPNTMVERDAEVHAWSVSDKPAERPQILQGQYPAEGQPPRLSKQTRVVNTRQFNIDYKVEDVGPSGVGSVELYVTEDDGQQWFRYGTDTDLQSPFTVETPRDGLYGFDLRVRSGAGLATDPPQPGEKPSVVVVVDQTPPMVRLEGAAQGRGDDLTKVLVRWTVSDQHPASRPVSLSYSTDPNGIWEPITGWIENTGSYVWSLAPNMPNRLYLRVTARDAAGNLSRAESDQPVLIDLSRPSARIVDVEASTAQ